MSQVRKVDAAFLLEMRELIALGRSYTTARQAYDALPSLLAELEITRSQLLEKQREVENLLADYDNDMGKYRAKIARLEQDMTPRSFPLSPEMGFSLVTEKRDPTATIDNPIIPVDKVEDSRRTT